jgi:hypothetical protein
MYIFKINGGFLAASSHRGILTPGSRLLEIRDLPHLPNHCDNANTSIACVQTISSLANIALVLVEGRVNITSYSV